MNPGDAKKLDSGFQSIVMIWGAILLSLGVYLAVCLSFGEKLPFVVGEGVPLMTLKYAFFGLSMATLAGVHFLRAFLLKHPGVGSISKAPGSSSAVARYTLVVIIVSALLESVGVYGLLIFLLAGDTLTLYQLLGLSAAAMLYYRPKKGELLELARRMED